MKPVLPLILCLACAQAPSQGAATPKPAATRTEQPNVLFLVIDDLNDWVGALGGHPQARTPNLDRLARRGVLFTNAHCAAPACNPSRTAVLTGIPPHRSGVYHNGQPFRQALPNAVTIPQHFAKAGYKTRGAGKVFGSADKASWDKYYPKKTRHRPDDPMPEDLPLNGIPRTGNFDWGPIAVADEAMGDAKVAAWVTKQLGEKRKKPFFLACGFFRPHLPWHVPPAYFAPFPLDGILVPRTLSGDLNDVPKAGRKMAKPKGDHRTVLRHGQWKRAVQGYLASIAFADAMLGRVLTALDQSRYADNTIIVLWGDHGWHLGEKEHWRKFALWERATHTPLMIIAPKGTPGLLAGTKAGTRCDRPVSLIDIYPTLIELCGLPPRDGIDGRSLVPLLRDPATPWDRPVLTTHGRGNHAVRDQRWRLIRYADGTEELYDHASDPHEWHNLAGDRRHAAVRTALRRALPAAEAPLFRDLPTRKK